MRVVKPAKLTIASKPVRTSKVPSQNAIIRAVASSTAIETGKSMPEIEGSLLSKHPGRRKVALAS
jgi:hypothetical protein